MQCIILIAAPAAGKGTTAKYLEDKYNFKHISTGDLLRNEVKNNTELGKKIKSLIDKGSLVSDDVIMDLFEKKFSSLTSNVVLDGMPRTINQAKMLDEIDKKNLWDYFVDILGNMGRYYNDLFEETVSKN